MPAGSIYVADGWNHVIRKLQPLPPAVAVSAVTNAASNLGGSIAPGEIVVLYGAGIGPAQLVQFSLDSSGRVPKQLGGVRVLFNGVAAPLLYASAAQVAAIVPYTVSGETARVEVEFRDQKSDPFSVRIQASAPALFTVDQTGRGQAAALNQDNSFNEAGRPARPGEIVVLYGTGEGETSPPGEDGKPAVLPLPQPRLPVRVSIGGRDAEVLYAGGAYGLVAGVLQVNVRLPEGTPAGAVPVTVTIGPTPSPPGVTISVASAR